MYTAITLVASMQPSSGRKVLQILTCIGGLDVGLDVGGGRRDSAGLDRCRHAAGAAYLRWSTEIDPVDEAQLAEFIERLPAGVLRAKGFAEVILPGGGTAGRLVQVVGRSVGITPWDVPGRGALEVIGVGDVLGLSALEDLANDYLRSQ